MNEAVKTSIFVAVALAIGVMAYISRPATETNNWEDEINAPLFPDFTDPLQAESMKITRFDADRGQLLSFEVAKTSDGWQIKSKEGYPANATEQMISAANSLVDLTVLNIAGSLPGEQAEYGVIEPNTNAISADNEDIGQMVTIDDGSDKELASLIIGKADKKDPQLRYVRVPSRDQIYQVRLDPAVFSTEFSDWIEKDLLQINPYDVTSLSFRNHAVQANPNGSLTVLPQMDVKVDYNAERGDWRLVSLKETSPNDLTDLKDAQLPSGEKLNTEKLNEIRLSLDDLTIVDVYRKPERLAAAIKAGDGLKGLKQEDVPALSNNGFFPYTSPRKTDKELLGVNGELIIETQDAIRYRVLFGKEVLGGDDKNQKQQFLFIQTELADDMLPPPTLQEVPEIKEGEDQDIEAQAKAREKILQENDATMAAYREKKNVAMQKMFELNTRFAEWYYVVKAEDVAKIMLQRDELGASINASSGSSGRTFPGGGGMGMLRPRSAQPPATQPMPQEPPKEEPADKQPKNEEPAKEEAAKESDSAKEEPTDTSGEPMKSTEDATEPAKEEKSAETEEAPEAAEETDQSEEGAPQ